MLASSAFDVIVDVRTDITTIQSAMGVCSQDNLLWDDLTGPEHLLFFARLRRVAPKAIKQHIEERTEIRRDGQTLMSQDAAVRRDFTAQLVGLRFHVSHLARKILDFSLTFLVVALLFL